MYYRGSFQDTCTYTKGFALVELYYYNYMYMLSSSYSLSDSNVCQFPSLVIVYQREADGSEGQGSLEQWY